MATNTCCVKMFKNDLLVLVYLCVILVLIVTPNTIYLYKHKWMNFRNS